MKTHQRVITATEFKARCLRILEELDPNGILVTKKGRPIAKVIPVSEESNKRLIGSMKGKIKVRGDLLSTGVKWNAQS